MKLPHQIAFLAVTVSLLYCAGSPMTLANDKPAQSLFDGHSLDGWEYNRKHWRIENQSIVGEIPAGQTLNHNTWLIWRGGELKDFELRIKVKLTGAAAANSGIQVRCQAKDPSHVSGYQADLDMGATWLGRIYDEHGRALLVERGQRVLIERDGKRATHTFAPAGMYATILRVNEWNDYRIVGVGERLAVFVNGTLFSDLIDRESSARDLSGHLAFQLHSGPETRVELRDIHLETLDGDDIRLGDFKLPEADTTEKPIDGVLVRDASGKSLNLGFESGDLTNWKATGTAFLGQPVEQDTIGSRWTGQVSNKQGQFSLVVTNFRSQTPHREP